METAEVEFIRLAADRHALEPFLSPPLRAARAADVLRTAMRSWIEPDLRERAQRLVDGEMLAHMIAR
jgi:hypothetical protein